ncbi:MAG: CD1871A family CXXC motif-containing protein [Deferrisomatales bacterium]
MGVPRWWVAAFGAAVALAALGAALGEPGQLLMQAASVCLACLGIG